MTDEDSMNRNEKEIVCIFVLGQHHEAPMDYYRVKRMKEIAREYTELITSARREKTKERLREQALQAIEDVQMVDDFLQRLGVR